MVLESMPKPFGFFNPACWKASGNDQRYSDRLEALFQLDQFRFKLTKYDFTDGILINYYY